MAMRLSQWGRHSITVILSQSRLGWIKERECGLGGVDPDSYVNLISNKLCRALL